MRVQFSITQAEWDELQETAQKNGYPDVPSYCKDLALNQRTYQKMWQSIETQIASMPPGTIFTLSELVDAPPANLGVKLYQNQNKLGITVLKEKDTKLRANRFEKL